MLILLSLLLLLLPTLFQYQLGNKSLCQSVNIKFIWVCLMSLLLQAGITFVSFSLVLYDLTRGANKCAMGAVGIFVISMMVTGLLLIVMVVQFLNRNSYVKS